MHLYLYFLKLFLKVFKNIYNVMKLNSCHEQNVANGQNCFKLNHSLIQLIPHLFCYFHFLIRSKNIKKLKIKIIRKNN